MHLCGFFQSSDSQVVAQCKPVPFARQIGMFRLNTAPPYCILWEPSRLGPPFWRGPSKRNPSDTIRNSLPKLPPPGLGISSTRLGLHNMSLSVVHVPFQDHT